MNVAKNTEIKKTINLNSANFSDVSLQQNLESKILNVGWSGFDAERQIDDAVSLSADVEVIKANSVAGNDESALQKTVDCSISVNKKASNKNVYNISILTHNWKSLLWTKTIYFL